MKMINIRQIVKIKVLGFRGLSKGEAGKMEQRLNTVVIGSLIGPPLGCTNRMPSNTPGVFENANPHDVWHFGCLWTLEIVPDTKGRIEHRMACSSSLAILNNMEQTKVYQSHD